MMGTRVSSLSVRPAGLCAGPAHPCDLRRHLRIAGGWIDNIMMRITDILTPSPDILLIILLAWPSKEPLEALATGRLGWMQTLGFNGVHLHHLRAAVLGRHGAYRPAPRS